ncbi:hypothetical protein [Halobacillus sp. KGW1]|uniref:hypothetical protein n=1 Tax=Halobacillus sp. KGW1 TaxID=1793726 RepID=UPI000780245A|nr:hypothetical protein [Halobacillus sp. KGW1]
MIHTFSIMLTLTNQELVNLYAAYGQDFQRFDHLKSAVKWINKSIKGVYSPITINWVNQLASDSWQISIKVDAVKMLSRSDIDENDYLEIENRLQQFLLEHQIDSAAYDDHILTRIDYKYDVCIPDVKERELLFHIFEKQTLNYRYKKKFKWGRDKDDNPLKYETSQYHSNKSTELIIYSKEDERIAKNENVLDYEKGIVRYELRLQNEHLNTMKRKDKSTRRPKKLWAYFRIRLWEEYMIKHVYPIVHRGDYYKIAKADRIIEDSLFSKYKKAKLRAFLVEISKSDIDKPANSVSKATYRQYLSDLELLNINPILIPKNRTDFPNSLKNPFNIEEHLSAL